MDASAAEKAYNPDRSGRKEVIVVGLSGGVKSFVTASLLKIQKYDVIGVTVQNDPQGFQGPLENVVKCHMNEQKLEEIRVFCKSLGIPHFVVRTGPEFQETVVETWKSSRIEGSLPRQCRPCHALRIKALHREMKRLGAKKLATGHLGKIFIQNESVFLRSSNDEKFDQSGLLSELSEEILRALLLPLSDLQYPEILRLAENFELKDLTTRTSTCFPGSEATLEFLEKNIPAAMMKSGSIVRANGDKVDDHEGVYHFVYGQQMRTKDEDEVFTEYDYASKDITIGSSESFLTQDFFVECEGVSDPESLIEPLMGYLRLEGKEIECWVTPKNLGRIHVELSEKKKLLSGQSVSIYKKPGRNSKLLMTGRVCCVLTPEEEGKEESSENTSQRSGIYTR